MAIVFKDLQKLVSQQQKENTRTSRGGFVLEVTGDYTGTLTGRGASHERRSHTH
jgi:hypothetical protein